MEQEIRYGNVECRNTEDKENRTLEGYAIVFNSPSRLLREDYKEFREIIDPKALDGVIAKSDVFALLNHDRHRGILARSKMGKGTLHLEVDDKGLYFRYQAPPTNLGDEVLAMVSRGDIDSCSFAFTVADEEWSRDKDGTAVRTVKAIDQLFDISQVYVPAYEATTVACRSFDDFLAKEEEQRKAEEEQRKAEEEEAQKRAEEEKEAKLKDYYAQLRQEYQDILNADKN